MQRVPALECLGKNYPAPSNLRLEAPSLPRLALIRSGRICDSRYNDSFYHPMLQRVVADCEGPGGERFGGVRKESQFYPNKLYSLLEIRDVVRRGKENKEARARVQVRRRRPV
jgi:hypothetical protein